MSKFEIYTKEVVIGNETYKLRPLSGRFLPKLYSVAKSFNKDSSDDGSLEGMSEDTISNIHSVCLETLKASYPDQKPEDLDLFVSSNLWALFKAVTEVNFDNIPKE